MPNSKCTFDDLVQRRRIYTGEKRNRAADELRRLKSLTPQPQLIPTASATQAHLELELLRTIGRNDYLFDGGWQPGPCPLGIEWMTPHVDRLDIGVPIRYLPSLLQAVMPYHHSNDEPRGICGLRYRLARNDTVVLYRLGLPGEIRLCGVARDQWWQCLNTMLHETDPTGDDRKSELWLRQPRHHDPDEIAHARQYAPGYGDPNKVLYGPLTSHASAFLRRHLAFGKKPYTTGMKIWLNPNTSIEVEWDHGPTHQAMIELLTDHRLGLPGFVAEHPSHSCFQEYCTSCLDAPDGRAIALRRDTRPSALWHEESHRAEYSAKARPRREQHLDKFRGSTTIAEPHTPVASRPDPTPDQQPKATAARPFN